MKRPKPTKNTYRLKLPKRFLIKSHGTDYYIIDRLILYTLLTLITIITIYAVTTHSINNHLYLTCHGPTPCINPLYLKDCTHLPTGLPYLTTNIDQRICEAKTLAPGYTYGDPPPLLIENAPAALILLIILATGSNHYLWNVGGEHTMNVKILVTPLTDKGRTAINQHFTSQGLKERAFRRAAKIKQEQLSDGSLLLHIPTTVTLTNATWEELAKSTMKANGANPEDYTILVNTE